MPEVKNLQSTEVKNLQSTEVKNLRSTEVKNLRSTGEHLVSAQSSLGKGDFKSPKSKLNELCQSMKFSPPKYQDQISDNGFVDVTVSIMIEGQDVCYSYTSEQAMSTKKYIKQCEENAAELAFKALTELYGTCLPSEHTPTQLGKNIYLCSYSLLPSYILLDKPVRSPSKLGPQRTFSCPELGKR